MLSPSELATWEKLQTATEILRREVGRDLWGDARLSDAEFTVLAHLQSAPAEGVRPSDCAREIGWDTSRLSHQLRRLEGRDFVAKTRGADDDGRAVRIALTDAGRTAYRRAIGPHLRAAKRWFADALEPEQLDALGGVLDAILAHAAALDSASRPARDVADS
ncbi:MarR family winged helix-turn-helix transcriptional regulator [Microbacterium sp. NPDC091313]